MKTATTILLLLSALGCVSPPSSTSFDSWSRFRGPNGTGVAEGEPLPAALDEEHTLWRTELPPGHSSPVVEGNRVFLTALDGEELRTLALDAADGRVLWSVAAPRPRRERFDQRNHAASPTPAVDAGRVCVFFPEFGLLAYDHEGGELWRVPLGPFENVYGMGASPILVDGVCVLPCDQNRGSFVVGVDARTGEVLWKVDRPLATSGHCTPIVRTAVDGRHEVVLPGSFLLDAYAPSSGERLWWVEGLCFEMKSVPLLHEGTIFINGYGSPMNDPGQVIDAGGFEDVLAERDADGSGTIEAGEMPAGRVAAWFSFVDLDGSETLDAKEWGYLRAALASRNGLLAIRPEPAGAEEPPRGDRTEGGVVWSYHRSIPQLPSCLVYEDVLYMLADAGGLVTTLDPRTGALLERGRIEEAVDNYYASPVGGDGKVFLVSEAGLAIVLPGGGSLEPLSVTDLGERCYATPALAEGRVYLRTERALYCFSDADQVR